MMVDENTETQPIPPMEPQMSDPLILHAIVKDSVNPDPAPASVEFKAPPLRGAAPPTAAQRAWLGSHKTYVRMSHHRAMKFSARGTLKQDGSFIPETAGHPVHDGGGDFGVGIPNAPARRR